MKWFSLHVHFIPVQRTFAELFVAVSEKKALVVILFIQITYM